jgi:hypothetical protein
MKELTAEDVKEYARHMADNFRHMRQDYVGSGIRTRKGDRQLMRLHGAITALNAVVRFVEDKGEGCLPDGSEYGKGRYYVRFIDSGNKVTYESEPFRSEKKAEAWFRRMAGLRGPKCRIVLERGKLKDRPAWYECVMSREAGEKL